MHDDRPSRRSALRLGLAALIAWPIAGCGGGSGTQSVEVSPEAMQKTQAYLQNYQKQMYEQHKAKSKTKKSR
jgi:hypothetical protein